MTDKERLAQLEIEVAELKGKLDAMMHILKPSMPTVYPPAYYPTPYTPVYPWDPWITYCTTAHVDTGNDLLIQALC